MKRIIATMLVVLISCQSEEKEQKNSMKSDGMNQNTIETSEKFEFIGDSLLSIEKFMKTSDYLKKLSFTKIHSESLYLDSDDKLDRITLLKIDSAINKDGKKFLFKDPGDYHLVTINLTKKNSKDTLSNIKGWVKPLFLLEAGTSSNSRVGSFFYIYQSQKSNVLVFEEYTYGNGSSSQSVINMYNDETFIIFNNDQRLKSIVKDDDGQLIISFRKKTGNSYSENEESYLITKGMKKIDNVPE